MSNLTFSSIFLNNSTYDEYNTYISPKQLSSLTRVNIFVGANNSGKSRLLRKIFSDDEIKFTLSTLDLALINASIENFKREFEETRTTKETIYYGNLLNEISKLQTFESVSKHMDFHKIEQVFDKLKSEFNYTEFIAGTIEAKVGLTISKYDKLFKKILPQSNGVTIYRFSNIYIPTLRGLRPVQTTSTQSKNYSFHENHDNYLHRTVTDFFHGKDNLQDSIYTGLSFYEDLDKFSRGDQGQRQQVQNFQSFLSKTFFNNEVVELIAAWKSDVVKVKIGMHEESIYNLGDGIQSLIILTYPLFFNQGRVLKIFIEEPETHLHPGYQRLFIETLLRPEFQTFQYFITTHSNHLLDITLDKSNISIFSLEKQKTNSDKPSFTITNLLDNHTNILLLLGAKNSSVFLSNCTIWVEGISDRIYLRKYLEVIQETMALKFKEDTHFSFVEYSGNNITHWSFLSDKDKSHPNILVERVCGKLFLITDSDNAGFRKNGTISKNPSKKAMRHQELKSRLGERYYCLQSREIENLLMPHVLQQHLSEQNSPDLDFGVLNYKEYQNEYLGKYIETKITGLCKSYSTDSGSILNKVDFAKKAVDKIKTKTDMSPEAIELAEKLYRFISDHN